MIPAMLPRRALLQGGAAAIGTLALPGVSPARPPRPTEAASAPHPLTGALVSWVVLHHRGVADLRLAHLGPDGRLLGQAATVSVAAPRVQAACRAAQAQAVATAAQAWGSDPAACLVGHGRIADPAGHAIGFAVWMDVA